MEGLTPLELERVSFPLARKGYETNAVDVMLKSAAAQLQQLLKSAKETEQRHAAELQELESFRQREKTLADTLLLAQKTADETRAVAHKEAELIVEVARQQAEEIKRKVASDVEFATEELQQLLLRRRNFESRFKSLLDEYAGSLENFQNLQLESEQADAA